MFKKYRDTLLTFPPLLFLFSLLSLTSSTNILPSFITTIPATIQTGSSVLTASAMVANGSFSSFTTTITYLNTYSGLPVFGYGFNYISSYWQQTSTNTETIIDVQSIMNTSYSQTLQLNFTVGSISIFSINYIVCSSSLFLDIRATYFNLTSTIAFATNTASNRQITLNLDAKGKSNSSNTVAAYTTIGLSIMRAKNTFEFQLSTVGYTSNTTTVTLTLMGNNGMRFIRLMLFNYEAVVTTINSPFFLDMGFGSTLGGTVPDSSGLSLTTIGTIFTGLTDWAIIDSSAVILYNMTISGRVYSLGIDNTVTRTQTAYIWYRQAICPAYYFNQSNFCVPCHYSCLACFSATATGCSSCDQLATNRIRFSSNNSCPCKTNYMDSGTAICQAILCYYDICTSCSSNYICTSCVSGTSRTVSNNTCVCINYSIDLYAPPDDTYVPSCQACYPTCLTCSLMSNANACTSCDLARDHRSLNASLSTCYCVDGYYEYPNLPTKQQLFIFKGVPCLPCSYSCATCTGPTICLTCNQSLNRYYNNVTKLCNCSDGYFDNNMIQSCFSCPFSCTTCSSSSVCLSCPFTRTITNNACPCNVGYYQAGISACQPCNYTCQTCTSSISCSTCNTAYSRSMSNGSCLCGSGFYDVVNVAICRSCDTTCLSCSGAGSNACTSCNSALYRTLTTNKTCDCIIGYYLDIDVSSINFGLCVICNYSCASCSNGNSCLTCNGTFNRILSNTSCLCSSKYYDDGGNQQCKSCMYFCLTCTNAISCLTCDSTRNSSNLATCVCLNGYFDSGLTSCSTCLVSCLTCNNANNCTSCATNRVITTLASCVCKARTYEPYCDPCSYSCLECLGAPSVCTSCNGTALRYLNVTSSQCVCFQGFYDDGQNELCLSCHYSCLTCNSNSSCLTCPVNRVSNGTYCSCISNMYQNSQNYTNCLPCHYSCLTCSSYSVCTLCDNTTSYRTSSPNTTLCVCLTGYFDNLVSAICVPCSSICMTCISSYICTDCNQAQHFYYDNGTCLCNTGYYFDSPTKSCIACDPSCNTCSSGTTCDTCKQNRTLTSTFCVCNSGLFDNPSTFVCSLCTYPCTACKNSSSNCTSCDSTRTLKTTTSTCACFGATYDSGLNCSSCLSTCQTCSNGATCTTCLSGSSRVLNNSLCVCPTGYHDQNGTVLNCTSCHYSCTSCINSISCSTCPTGRSNIVGGLCACPNTYYYDNGQNQQCIACGYNCYTCAVISTNCTSCLNSTYRNLTNGTCSCLAGYFDIVNVAICTTCHYSCQQCTSSSTCSKCNSSNYRNIMNGPLCYCTNGYFDITNIQLCSPCSYSCLTCITSPTTCLTCGNLRNFSNTSSSCICNDGYYDDGVTACASCMYSCATCTNGTTCLTCPDTRMKGSLLTCLCNPGTYDVFGLATCANCTNTCLTCSDYQVCILCDPASYRQLVNSSCVCPAGYYDAFPTNGTVSCQFCSSSCATCVSKFQCTSCNPNYHRVFNITTSLCSCVSGYFDDNINAPCNPCPSDCLTCYNSTLCLTCLSVRNISSNGRCTCINSTYQNGTNCQSCPIQCLTCNSSSVCTSCIGNRTLVNNACVCPIKFYSVPGTSTCNNCSYSCSSCLTQTQCSTCNSTLFRYQTSTFCLCRTGYYDDGGNQTCKTCFYSCLLCSNGTTCLTCNPANNRIFNTATSLCDCASGYYEDPTTKACIQCQVSCVTCTNGSACTLCNNNYHRTLNTTNNQCTCLAIGFFDTLLSPICSSCHYSCLSCLGSATYCTDCLNTTMRTLSTSSCVCMNGYYDVSLQSICSTCSIRCVTCQGASDNCTQCSIVNYRNITPACSCITGFYDSGLAVCATCNYVCLTCIMSQTCTSCDFNTSRRTMNNISSVCECINRYYDAGSNICQACSYSCLTCNNPSLCLTCSSTRVLTLSQCICLQKYYDDLSSLDCLACDYSCQSCLNGTACFSCDSTLMRTFNSSTYKCSCLVGYYDVGVQGCLRCDVSCYSCTNGTACSSCPPNINKTLNASSGSNLCVCLYGYYENVTAGVSLGYNSVCNPCYYACQTCISQASYCILCSNTSNRYLTTSHQCACNIGTFQIFGQQTCIACSTNCLTCTGTSNTSCLTCDNSTYFLSNSCYTSCPPFYNISTTTRTCVSCSSNCLSCPTSYTVCSQCNSPYFIFSYNSSYSLCVNSCPSYYYQINRTCYPCLSPCLSCTAAYTCTSCINLYYLVNGSCNPCHPLCLTCSGSTALNCLTCVPNYILKGSVCQKLSCPSYQFVQSVSGCTNCTPTFPNSLTCLSTGPTSCLDGYILSNNSCLTCSLVSGYTLDSATGRCKDYCGDNIIITDLCDDGNNLNGDGCSSICKIQSGWSCPNNTCNLIQSPAVKVTSISNNPAKHTITLILSLSVGLRLVNANFILVFSAITQYTYSVAPLNSFYTLYQLNIVYYETAANNNLNIQIKSPLSRLLITSNTSLSININLQVTVPIITNPPAIYVSKSQQQIYSKYMFGVLAALHVILLIFIAIFIGMRLKVMLLVIDALNSITILYILTALGMYNVSLVSYEAMRGLQPFIQSFGTTYSQSINNLSYFSFTSNFFGTTIIQITIIVITVIFSAFYSKKNPTDDDNQWHYYRVGFAFAFTFDILLGCFSTFFWNTYTSYESSYSWMFALLFLIYLCSQTLVYFSRNRDLSDGKKVLPAISFITNDLQIRDKGKDVNIFEFQEEISREKRKGMMSEWSDERTEVIDKEKDQTSKESEEVVKYFDLTPSSQTQYSMKNSNHIAAIHLPVCSLLFAFFFTIIVNIQTVTLRSTLFLVISIVHLACIFILKTSTLKSLRNIKLIAFSTFYIILSGLALASSVNSQTIDLVKMDIVIVTIVTAVLLFNIITFIVGVIKSEAYREYLINRKNQEIMQRTKRQNEARMKIYTRSELNKDTSKPIKPLRDNTNIISEQPESFEVKQQPPEIQISEQQAEEKESLKLSNLKKRQRRDEPTMLQGNNSSINNQIDHEISDINDSDFRHPNDLLNDKQMLQIKKSAQDPRSPSKKQGNRIKAINSSEMSLVSRKGETPSLFFENSLQRIDELRGVKRNVDKAEQKQDVSRKKSKRKKRPNVQTDVIQNEEIRQEIKDQQPPRQSKLMKNQQKLELRDSGEVLESILDEMDMPRGFKKPQDSSFRARIMSIDDISSIREEREQFVMQQRESEYEESVFNKILQDYQKYKNKKIDKKKLKAIKQKKIEKN